jgi:hypothetical protein
VWCDVVAVGFWSVAKTWGLNLLLKKNGILEKRKLGRMVLEEIEKLLV